MKKLPTVTTLRRWKRDALEEAFNCKQLRDPRMTQHKLMFENFAKVCDILVGEYPHIMNYDRIFKEIEELRSEVRQLKRSQMPGGAHP